MKTLQELADFFGLVVAVDTYRANGAIPMTNIRPYQQKELNK
jgi:hypothetical protein